MVPPIRIVCIVVWGNGWWLVLACSAIISLTEGPVGQCSPWCLVDWQLKQGWVGIGASATARTSCELLISSPSNPSSQGGYLCLHLHVLCEWVHTSP